MLVRPLAAASPPDVPVAPGQTAVAVLVALATAGTCWLSLRRLRGTTLAAPAAWAIGSAAALAAVEAYLLWRGAAEGALQRSALRFFAAAGTFCPPMAVLGAKRPQDRGWQWIVAALWLVVSLPAVQAVLRPAGDHLELSGLWTAFLAVLAVYGTVLNYGPTRYAAASLLYLLGQAALIAPATRLRTALPWTEDAWTAIGVTLLLTALWVARAKTAAIPVAERFGAELAACDLTPTARWLAFRDAFGLSWGLRILHRVNETAELAKWPVRLAWNGFVAADDVSKQVATAELPSESRAAIHATLDTLLRRFERVAAAGES
ncbi:MAG: hypothetical protein CMJ58_14610 [Planctomycetaceae bacterium]|nr:hypothetical protein [Planctomycetaceae bacterium]